MDFEKKKTDVLNELQIIENELNSASMNMQQLNEKINKLNIRKVFLNGQKELLEKMVSESVPKKPIELKEIPNNNDQGVVEDGQAH